MKEIKINPLIAIAIIFIVALAATFLVLHTLNDIQNSLPPQALYNIP